MSLLYVIRRFPTFSETFILQEVHELMRRGEDLAVWSLRTPESRDLVHPGAAEVSAQTNYLPRGPVGLIELAFAGILTLFTRPALAWPALGWVLRAAAHHRDPRPLMSFLEACYVGRRLAASCEHIHAHWAHGPATVALLLSRLSGRPFSFTGHAVDIFELVPPQLLRRKIAEARFVVAETKHGSRFMASLARPRDHSKLFVVRNGIDRGRFSPREHEPQGQPVILAVSRLVEKKGLDTLISACGLLVDRGVDFRCELIGEGPLRHELASQVDALGLQEQVHLAGSLDQNGVREAYERAAVFALPCRQMPKGDQDGLPVAILEALAMGVPVVTTPISGIPEAVKDGETGLLVPPQDPGALAEALRRILSRPSFRGHLSEEFDLGTSAARLQGLFHHKGIPT